MNMELLKIRFPLELMEILADSIPPYLHSRDYAPASIRSKLTAKQAEARKRRNKAAKIARRAARRR